ncbi:hypothetical protein PFUGPA_01942 [Plasmodium falciparum Palo Alto/Uganda]|uniref:Uncharacterized protein n=2 Tax=Plasmodium falciparum TaxID=5833 RepID=W4J2Q1_PLAFP|nr:hypothetical protein PFUGPA_01942 [Plasmodium falciparum Palo Alto/Uganda]ETW60249.1 hypothetical protein PFMC_03793 [Plasmodium falciparum CAMP/Malaysia]
MAQESTDIILSVIIDFEIYIIIFILLVYFATKKIHKIIDSNFYNDDKLFKRLSKHFYIAEVSAYFSPFRYIYQSAVYHSYYFLTIFILIYIFRLYSSYKKWMRQYFLSYFNLSNLNTPDINEPENIREYDGLHVTFIISFVLGNFASFYFYKYLCNIFKRDSRRYIDMKRTNVLKYCVELAKEAYNEFLKNQLQKKKKNSKNSKNSKNKKNKKIPKFKFDLNANPETLIINSDINTYEPSQNNVGPEIKLKKKNNILFKMLNIVYINTHVLHGENTLYEDRPLKKENDSKFDSKKLLLKLLKFLWNCIMALRKIQTTKDEVKVVDGTKEDLPNKMVDKENGTTDKENGTTDKENGMTDKESGTTDKENGMTDKESGTTDKENGTKDKENGTTDKDNITTDKEYEINDVKEEMSESINNTNNMNNIDNIDNLNNSYNTNSTTNEEHISPSININDIKINNNDETDEAKYTPQGSTISNISINGNEKYADKVTDKNNILMSSLNAEELKKNQNNIINTNNNDNNNNNNNINNNNVGNLKNDVVNTENTTAESEYTDINLCDIKSGHHDVYVCNSHYQFKSIIEILMLNLPIYFFFKNKLYVKTSFTIMLYILNFIIWNIITLLSMIKPSLLVYYYIINEHISQILTENINEFEKKIMLHFFYGFFCSSLIYLKYYFKIEFKLIKIEHMNNIDRMINNSLKEAHKLKLRKMIKNYDKLKIFPLLLDYQKNCIYVEKTLLKNNKEIEELIKLRKLKNEQLCLENINQIAKYCDKETANELLKKIKNILLNELPERLTNNLTQKLTDEIYDSMKKEHLSSEDKENNNSTSSSSFSPLKKGLIQRFIHGRKVNKNDEDLNNNSKY